MKYLFGCLSILLICLFQNIHISHASINFTLTPIKYELNLAPGESITLPASIRNNGTGAVTLPTAKSDFESRGSGGVPSLVRRSELVFPDQSLSTWITLSADQVTIPAGEEGTIDFTIEVPVNATPGGHYGAVIFNNPGSESAANSDIKINVDYGILILVNVAGEVVVDVGIGEPIISGGGSASKTSSSTSSNSENTETSSSQDINQGDTNKNNDSEDTEDIRSESDSNDEIELKDGAWYTGDDAQGNSIYIYPDVCPIGDFTSSKYDNKCFNFGRDDSVLFQEELIDNNTAKEDSSPTIDANNDEPSLFGDDFNVNFIFPIENKGNTHIKPTGKVVLKDENNNLIKAIGKEVIVNERGAIIGEKIVDYIPINDQQGNVLPQTSRIFESQWKGFPYKTYDDEGNQIVNYWSPSEYYTQKNKQEAGFLMFWERVTEKRTHKDITAEIELVYLDEKGNEIEFTTAKDFSVQYIEQEVTLNPYIILALLLSTTALFMLLGAYKWWSIVIKTSNCWNCDYKMKSSWTTCPHCKCLKNKRKQKAFEEKQSKKSTPIKASPTKKKVVAKAKTTTKSKTTANKTLTAKKKITTKK